MKLYYMPTTRAVRPRWLLEEMDIPYDLIRVTMDMSRSGEYRNLHPHGKVPVLVDNNTTVFESTAICTYLADHYCNLDTHKRFAPTIDSPARAYYYQWLFYASLTLEAPVEQYLFNVLPGLPENVMPQKMRASISLEEAKQWFEKVCEPLNQHLKDNRYLVENIFSVADVATGGVLLWALKLGMLKQDSPVKTYISHLMERPAFQRADEDFYAKMD